jgi:hypothetical protein
MKYQDIILKCKGLVAEHENVSRWMKIMRENKWFAVGILAAVVSLTIGSWFLLSRSGDSGIVHPSSSGRSYSNANASDGSVVSEYDYTDAPDHIGEKAIISGTVLRTFTAKSGVTFLDFCQGFDACPFSAVIFASDLKKFGDLKSYERAVKLTGVIKNYQGQAEMILNSPNQVE